MVTKKTLNSSCILCLNGGSSSLKFSLYELSDQESLIANGAVDRIGLPKGMLRFQSKIGRAQEETAQDFFTHETAIQAIFQWLEQGQFPQPMAVGHRIVHGGPGHIRPERITSDLLESLTRFVDFAPLHMPIQINLIQTVLKKFPELPQVACFDTAFHRAMPEIHQYFPLPSRFFHEGIRRYGFHGLSYESIMDRLSEMASGRVVIAHLGHGASLAAVRNLNPIDTTMGFSPTGGLMMGTRSGDLDPGVLLYFIRELGYDLDHLDELVNRQAGLLGISGVSSDMKTLLELEKDPSQARMAIELFCLQLRKQIGAMSASLGGLDLLVFTGGIGERGAPIRWKTCQDLEYLGILLDPKKNERHADTISRKDSRVIVRVMPTNEDLMIARHTRDSVLFRGSGD